MRRLVVRLQITDASRNCNDEHIAARSRSNCSFHVVTIAKYDTPWRKPRGCLSGLGFGWKLASAESCSNAVTNDEEVLPEASFLQARC